MERSLMLGYNKETDQYLLVILRANGTIQQYVVCSNYHPEARFGEQWDWGHYFNPAMNEDAFRNAINYFYRLDEDKEENYLYQLLKQHIGHEVEIAEYGNGDNFALEDVDTGEVIFDTDGYDLVGLD